jgi:hypothetical protein
VLFADLALAVTNQLQAFGVVADNAPEAAVKLVCLAESYGQLLQLDQHNLLPCGAIPIRTSNAAIPFDSELLVTFNQTFPTQFVIRLLAYPVRHIVCHVKFQLSLNTESHN